MIDVIPIPAFQDNYIWLIRQQDSATAVIVDPGDDSPVLDKLADTGLTPTALLITHHHRDHTGGIKGILSHFDIPVYGPAHESIPGITHALTQGDRIRLEPMGLDLEILDVPGHTAGHIAYYGNKSLFIGDTLFMAGCGRLFEGTARQMYQSLGRIRALPDDTAIYCAHEYTLANLAFAAAVEPDNGDIKQRTETCKARRSQGIPTVPGDLKTERQTNPFLRTEEVSVLMAAEKHAGHPLEDPVEVFACLRQWKDNF